jgi:hypothetical protein
MSHGQSGCSEGSFEKAACVSAIVRYGALTTAQARIVAYALLSEAVRKDDSLDQSR